jgi:hypothetical protein
MKNKWLPVAVALLAFAPSCSDDFIEVPNENTLTESSFWQNEAHALQALTAAYASLQGFDGSKWTFFEENYIGVTYRSDEIYNNQAEAYGRALASFTSTTDESTGFNLWRTCYTGIGRANQIIRRVPGIADIPADSRAGIVAEAHFLRALNYFYLVCSFENVPLVTEYETDPDNLYPSQATPAAVWAQIERDLNDAVGGLPESYPDEWKGRVTKWAAKAMLGKVLLFQEKWPEAESAFREVVESGQFSLLPQYADNFNGNSENGPESVFEIQFSGDRANGNDERHPFNYEVTPYALGGWELFYPSEWLKDEMKKDLKTDGSFSDRVLASIFFDAPESEMFNLDTKETVKYADVAAGLNHPVYWKKFNNNTDVNNYVGTNVTLIRYADVLLMYAEALNENGKTTEAIQQVDVVRARSGAAGLGNMTKDALRTQIRHHERPCELAMEFGIRWLDLYRWEKGSAAKESTRATLVAHGKTFIDNYAEPKHRLNPIPAQERSINPNLEQNPGW